MEAARAALESAIGVLDGLIVEEDTARPVRPNKTPNPRKVSCLPCRQSKCRCLGEEGVSCPRCVANGLECTFAPREKPGRKRGNSRRSLLLQSSRQKLIDALSALPSIASSDTCELPFQPEASTSSAHADLPPFRPVSPTGSATPFEQDNPELPVTDFDNALAVLSEVAIDRDKAVQDEFEWTAAGERFYAKGLYEPKEEDPGQDPVVLGLIAEATLERLVNLFFSKLWRHVWLLSPKLHTPFFLRAVSPFLTTVVCAIAASYDPEATPIEALALQEYAASLGQAALQKQYRTPEVVQAFLLQAHWLPPGESWSDDRAWAFVGYAARIATEIRLELDFSNKDAERYKRLHPLADETIPLLRSDRRRTWMALARTDLTMSIQTGRVNSISGIQLVVAASVRSLPSVEPQDPLYSCFAAEAFNRHVAKTLVLHARMREVAASRADYREIFNERWTSSIAEWRQDWPGIDTSTLIAHFHIKILLFALSLRFQGPPQPVLQQCQAAAWEIVQLAAAWTPEELVYINNSTIISIAYGAALLVKFLGISTSLTHELVHTTASLGRSVVQNLLQIVEKRPNSASLASVQAARLHLLVERFQPFLSEQYPSRSTDPPDPSSSAFAAINLAATADPFTLSHTDPFLPSAISGDLTPSLLLPVDGATGLNPEQSWFMSDPLDPLNAFMSGAGTGTSEGTGGAGDFWADGNWLDGVLRGEGGES